MSIEKKKKRSAFDPTFLQYHPQFSFQTVKRQNKTLKTKYSVGHLRPRLWRRHGYKHVVLIGARQIKKKTFPRRYHLMSKNLT